MEERQGYKPLVTKPESGIFVVNTVNQSLTTSNETLEDITGLVVPVLANTNYIWRSIVPHNAHATPDIDFGLSGPAGATAVWGGVGTAVAAVLAIGDELGLQGQGANVFLSIGGVLYIGATAGTFKIKAAQATSSAEAVTILKGASLRVWKV